jgi:hypothetical protein
MRFAALCDHASIAYARNYEADSTFRHSQRQAFVAEEISALTPISRILIAAEELTQGAA